ncbi:NUDIX hydrolase [Streptomyces aureus]|uniref:NUDIX hydrolase n=1 Tax=Streptomyces aureus TaxID=193461 RepID=UPI00068EAE5D|nr:NUDIX hydrolase [Streptomyces aureus]
MDHEYSTVSRPVDGPAFFSVEETRTTHPAMPKEHVHHVVRHPGGSAVVAVLDDDRVLLVEQYRPAVDQVLLELPAGRTEKGEMPEETAARELLEETGYVAGRMVPLLAFHNAPSFCDGVTRLFAAFDLERAPDIAVEQLPLRTRQVPLTEIPRLLADGSVTDANAIIGLLHLVNYRNGALRG